MTQTSFISRSAWFLWLAAFICALYPVNEWQLELFAGCVGFTFIWSCAMLARDVKAGWNLPKSKVLAIAGAFWLLVFASVFWSEIKPISIMGLCFFSVFPLSFFVGVMAGRDEAFRFVAYALAVIFSVLSIWAIFQFFFLNTYFFGQARHPLADPSSLGALFSLGFFASLGWLFLERPKRERVFAGILATLLLCGIICTVARGPVFAMIPALVLLFVVLWQQVKVRRKALLYILIATSVFYGITLTGIQKKYDIGERLFGTLNMGLEEASNNRLNIWTSALEIAKDHPLLGTGIGTFMFYYPEYKLPGDAAGTFLVHNDPLQFWVELGILGPILFYAFVLAAALRSFAALKRLKGAEHVRERVIVAAILAGLTAMVIGSHVGFNHYNLSILMISGFLLAVWFRVTSRVLEETPRLVVMPDNIPAGASRILIALPFVMIGWLQISIIAGEHFVNKARDNLFAEQMFDFADNINNAGRVSMGLNYRAYLLAVNVPVAILELNNPKLSVEQQKKLYEQARGYMDNVLAINPRDTTALYYLGQVQKLVDKSVIPEGTPTAEEYYKKALELDPTHLGARMALYKLYRAEKRPLQEQTDILAEGFNFHYNTPLAEEYYGELGRVYIEADNSIKIKEVAQRAYDFRKRSIFSAIRQNTSIPQAIIGGEEIFNRSP